MKMLRFWPEAILLLLAVVILCAQCFAPPILGLANNGDFPKLIGRYSLWPVPAERGGDFFYVVKHYQVDPQFHWDSGHFSSELLPVQLAFQIHRLFGLSNFDIRLIGVIHATLFLIAFSLFCYRMHTETPALRLIVGLAAIWIFTDIAYVSYFNAFYMDSGAIVFLLILIGLLINAKSPKGWIIATAVVCLFLTVKSQHTPTLIALIGFGLFHLWRSQRKLAMTLAVILTVCAGLFSSLVLREWKATALFNVVFFHLLPKAPDPAVALLELNLDSSYAQYRGMHAFVPESPTQNNDWLLRFYDRCNHGTLMRYYLRHPSFVLASLHEDLVSEAWQIRQGNLGNYTRASGQPPATLARSFDTWSNLRSALFVWWPYHAVIWLLGFAILWRTPLGWMLVTMAAIEFGLASLLDALETHRHLLLFHLLTDITILMAIFGLAKRVQTRFTIREQ